METLTQCQRLLTQSRGANRSSNNYTVMGTIIRSNYADIKKKLKEEIISSILKLQANSSTAERKKNSDSEVRQQRMGTWKGKSSKRAKKSPKKLAPNKKKPLDTDATNKWLDEYSDRFYPKKKEKQGLARRCNITINQFSSLFNKHYRNCTKGKGKAAKK